MSESQLPDKYDPKTLLGKALIDFNKIELPEMIEKNLIRSACRLITGVVDIPVAWLKSIERNIARETEALDLISKSNAEDITRLNSQDQEFIKSTANYYSLKQLKEASNRRAILNLAVNELNENVELEDSKNEIDEDWLDMFSKLAESKSSRELHIIFSKILRGEIRSPGSFSPKTIQALTILDKETAKHFIKYCSVAYSSSTGKHQNVIIFGNGPHRGRGLFNKLGANVPEPFFEDKAGKASLQESGLLSYDESELISFELSELLKPHFIGSVEQCYVKTKDENIRSRTEFRILNFTSVGLQLKGVINPPANQEFIDLFNERFKHNDYMTLKS